MRQRITQAELQTKNLDFNPPQNDRRHALTRSTHKTLSAFLKATDPTSSMNTLCSARITNHLKTGPAAVLSRRRDETVQRIHVLLRDCLMPFTGAAKALGAGDVLPVEELGAAWV